MRFFRVIQWTAGVHFLALALAYFIQPKALAPMSKPMRAVTVSLKPPPKKELPSPKTAMTTQKKPSTPAKKTVPKAKKTAAKTPSKPSPKKPIPHPKKTAPPSAKPTSAPPKSTPLPAPAAPMPMPSDYQRELIARLKEGLELPEIGAVELKISFGKNGEISRIEMLSSASEANARYLLLAIKKIELPPLPRNLRGQVEPLIIEFSTPRDGS